MSLAESLERAAEALPGDADAIRPANGDAQRLAESLDETAAVRLLGWMLRNETALADELIEAWLDREGGPATLASVEEASLPKVGRKLLRRALHRARSRGIDTVPARRLAADRRVARLPSLDEALDAAYVAPYDPRGARLVYLVESTPAGGARLFESLIDEANGIVDFQVYRANRRQVHQFVRDIVRRKRHACVRAPSKAVRALIAARAERQPADRPLPRGFIEHRSRLLGDVGEAATPGELARAELGTDAGAESLDALAARIRADEIGPWPPAAERLTAAVESVRARVEAGELGDEHAAPVETALREATEQLYRGDAGALMAERFEETAYLFWKSGQADEGCACLAAARAFRADELAENPVVRAMVEVIFEVLLDDLRGKLAKPGDRE